MSESHENQESAVPEEMRKAWEKTLPAIEKFIRPQYFQSFILTIRLLEGKGNTLVLGFPERFYRDWVYDHYSALIQERFDEASGYRFKLEFVSEPRLSQSQAAATPARTKALPPLEDPAKPAPQATPSHESGSSDRAQPPTTRNLNHRYSFETFVVGASNQFAHAAAFTVSEAPGKHYNPLFIYGDVGLGKTHLMNAIALKIHEKFPKLRVHYTTFERFTNHMIESIRFERMEEFRDRYRRDSDVLIIDDIQFIAGKERTQEEFFHTFNALYELKKQIVLSSDRPPTEIQGLEDRLRSRFEMGLIVDIQPPEIETRVAIVFKKAEIDGIKIDQDVAFYLAKLYRSNIRELEGALLKLTAYASLTGTEIDLELAESVLKASSIESGQQSSKDPEEIMKTVCKHFQISLTDLRSDKKNRQLALARQVAMFLCRKHSHLSFPDIGTLFGGKNHTTVLHAVRRIDKLKGADPMVREMTQRLEVELQG